MRTATGPVVRSSGQATVEFALVMPVLILMTLAVVQVGLVVRDRVLVTHAAREAVREAAVGSGAAEVAAAAGRASPLDADRMSVTTSRQGSRVVVTVRYDSPTNVFMVGRLLGDVALEATATMRFEGLD